MENILTTQDPDGIIVKKIKTPTEVMIKIMAPVGVTVKIEVENYTLPLAVEEPTTTSKMSEIVSDMSLSELSGPPKSATPRFKSKKTKKTISQLYEEHLERFLEGGKFKPLKGWYESSPWETTPSGKLFVRQLSGWNYKLVATDETSAGKTGVRIKWDDRFGKKRMHEYRIIRWESVLDWATPPEQVLKSLQNPTELARVTSDSFLDLSAEIGKSYVYSVESTETQEGQPLRTVNSDIIEVLF